MLVIVGNYYNIRKLKRWFDKRAFLAKLSSEDNPVKVMVSSTIEDLKEYRDTVRNACVKAGCGEPLMMEHLAPQDHTPAAVSIKMVNDADVYLGIFAWRYGTCPDGGERSYTEIEYDEAVKQGKTIIPFFMDKDHPWPISRTDRDEKAAKLDKLKEKVAKDRTSPHPFTSPDNLHGHVYHALIELNKSLQPAPEPVSTPFKASSELKSRIDDLSEELTSSPFVGRTTKLAQLDKFLERPSGFLLVTGDAGYGKSALLAHWLKQRPAEPFVVKHIFSCRSDLTRSLLEFYRSTLVTLSNLWNQPLSQLPSSEREARDALFTLLDEVRISEAGKTTPVLLVVDGLDEAADQCNYPFFPRKLPTGMHVVVSVRLGDSEEVPDYLTGWLDQCDERLFIGLLDREALVEWMRGLGGFVAQIADDSSAVDALLKKTNGLPLHLAFLFEDLNRSAHGRSDFDNLIAQTPYGFSNYVNMQFRSLVESPVGQEQRWREFFGLLVEAKAELQHADIDAILGMTIWELCVMPPELHRWVSQRGDSYSFRNEALRLAFARLKPWPEARKRLLEYARDWAKHQRPYALRSLVPHLREEGETAAWLEIAGNLDFLTQLGEAFPYEPLLPMQTIEDAMTEAIRCNNHQTLCHLIFVHATWMPDPRRINPLESVLTNPAMAWQQIKLAAATDPSTEAIWQVLVAWYCAVNGKTEEAKHALSQISTLRELHVVYWGQIVGLILPRLMEVDEALTVKVALALLDTAELPRFLGAAREPAEAIAITQKWYDTGNFKTDTGWKALWRSLAEKNELPAIFEATRNLRQIFYRTNALVEVALTLGRLGRLDGLRACLAEIDTHPSPKLENADSLTKARIVILAFIGSLRLKNGDQLGLNDLTKARNLAIHDMPPMPRQKSEAIALTGVAWAQAGQVEEASSAFSQAMAFAQEGFYPLVIKASSMVDIALCLLSAYESCPGLAPVVIKMLQTMEELPHERFPAELQNGLPRIIAEGWDEVGHCEHAWEWIKEIPNHQFRGKALAHFVEFRLRGDNPHEARQLIEEKGGKYPGWALVQLGAYHTRREEWVDAAAAFARAVQSGSTRGGKLNAPISTSVLLGDLARAFELIGQHSIVEKYADAAVRRARMCKKHYALWSLLNVAEITFVLQSSNLGVKALDEATLGAFKEMDDPERISLLCFVARVQHLVAHQPEFAQEAIARAMTIIEKHIPDRVKGMRARCEIAETLHLCGLDNQAQGLLARIYVFAERRETRPSDKANEIIAEAALGHARAANIKGAKRLLDLLGDYRSNAAFRARTIIHTYENKDDEAEAEICKVGNENFRTKIRRDIACTLTRLGRVDQALTVARRIQADRDIALPRIALNFIECGHPEAFYQLLIPAARFPNATSMMLAGLLRLHPELAPVISNLLGQYVPDIFSTETENKENEEVSAW